MVSEVSIGRSFVLPSRCCGLFLMLLFVGDGCIGVLVSSHVSECVVGNVKGAICCRYFRLGASVTVFRWFMSLIIAFPVVVGFFLLFRSIVHWKSPTRSFLFHQFTIEGLGKARLCF